MNKWWKDWEEKRRQKRDVTGHNEAGREGEEEGTTDQSEDK